VAVVQYKFTHKQYTEYRERTYIIVKRKKIGQDENIWIKGKTNKKNNWDKKKKLDEKKNSDKRKIWIKRKIFG
jgi:hypothetical protein